MEWLVDLNLYLGVEAVLFVEASGVLLSFFVGLPFLIGSGCLVNEFEFFNPLGGDTESSLTHNSIMNNSRVFEIEFNVEWVIFLE